MSYPNLSVSAVYYKDPGDTIHHLPDTMFSPGNTKLKIMPALIKLSLLEGQRGWTKYSVGSEDGANGQI